jgi:hypothetical protein
LVVSVVFAVLVLLHAPLLTLPYFWDEAGFYVPAARDFFLHGSLIPETTLLTAHPPMPAIYLAGWWKVLGYSPLVTRLAMLLVAAFGLLQVFLLSELVANRKVAIATSFLVALFPVYFAQSSLAHADLSAAALSLLGLRLYLRPGASRWKVALAFSLAALAKETAILVPLTLLAWDLLAPRLPERTRWQRSPQLAALALPFVVLGFWYVFHYVRTGHVFGNADFFRYNVTATLNPVRFILAAIQRVWQVTGHMNMWVLTLLMIAAMVLPPVTDGQTTRPRIAIPVQLLFLSIILVHVVFHSVVGGALLTRYMMPVIPLVVVIAVSTLHRRVRMWPWLVAFVAVTFVFGWFVNPPYRFAPEDNLNYADFVRLHQRAAEQLQGRFPGARVLTAWTASDELTKPYLGFVERPIKVVRIENFSYGQLLLARQNADYDLALVFSTKYEPPRRLVTWRFWEDATYRFFDYHRDLQPEVAAQLLGGLIVYQEHKSGQWIAIIDLQRVQNAGLSRLEARPVISRASGTNVINSTVTPR